MVLGHDQDNDETEDLAGVGLGAGNSYLKSGMTLSTQTVEPTDDQSSATLAIPKTRRITVNMNVFRITNSHLSAPRPGCQQFLQTER